MRRLTIAGATFVALALVLAWAPVASASPSAPVRTGQTTCPTNEAPGTPATTDALSVVKVSGLLDPVLADLVSKTVRQADEQGLVGVVLQVNSTGTVLSESQLRDLLRQVRDATVPVHVWVGPSGSRAYGGIAQLAGVADSIGMSAGTRLGKIGSPLLPRTDYQPAFAAQIDRLATGTLSNREALRLDVATGPADVLGQYVIGLPGVKSRVTGTGDQRRCAPTTRVLFSALPLGNQLMHTVASPAVAYLLFVLGMALIVFEFFTAGVGVAGLVGAGGFVLGCYGLAVLPARWWAVALLVLSMVGFAIDVQTGVPRFWTGVGVVSLLVGSFFLYDGISVPWITLLVVIVGVILFMLAGMPAMVRTRFSTPTIGRGWMVGMEGEAVTDVAPEGVVSIQGAPWRARTNRATPIAAGDAVRVVEVQGLLLEVEPEEGGAIDYRERARARRAGADGEADTGGDDGPDEPSDQPG